MALFSNSITLYFYRSNFTQNYVMFLMLALGFYKINKKMVDLILPKTSILNITVNDIKRRYCGGQFHCQTVSFDRLP